MSQLIGQLLDAPSCNDAAGVQDCEVLHGVAHEIHVLFDKENVTALFVGNPFDDLVDLLDDRRLQSFRRLVQQYQPRLLNEGAANRELLLLSAAQHPTTPLADVVKGREVVVQEVRYVLRRLPYPHQREQDVLLDGQVRNDLPSLWYVRNAESGPCVGFEFRDVRVVEKDS